MNSLKTDFQNKHLKGRRSSPSHLLQTESFKDDDPLFSRPRSIYVP